MMNTELKTAWLEALRGGEYKQINGDICKIDKDRNPIGFCCLGVLCDIDDNLVFGGHYYVYKETNETAAAGWLSDEYANSVGLDRDLMYRLSDMNDRDGLGFAEIADVIEKEA